MTDDAEIRVNSSNDLEDFLEPYLSGQWGVMQVADLHKCYFSAIASCF
jgi:hypothetical protein